MKLAPLTDAELAQLQDLAEMATPGPWSLWTSNSYRRFGSDAPGGSTPVCEPVTQRDGHPDLSFRNGGADGPDAGFIAAANPATLLRLLAELRDHRAAMGSAASMVPGPVHHLSPPPLYDPAGPTLLGLPVVSTVPADAPAPAPLGAPAAVVDLAEERVRRNEAAGAAAHAAGQAFRFADYRFDDTGVGLIEGDFPVIVLTDPDSLTGIRMARSCAKKLSEALASVAEAWRTNPAEPLEPR